jgi:hypothetical protein
MAFILHTTESPGKRKEILTGVVVLGASGAISSQVCEGFTVVKTATETGRYTVTLGKKYSTVEYAHGVIEGAADAVPIAAKGQVVMLRNVSASSKTLNLQILTPSLAGGAAVDIEAEDSTTLRILIVAKRGTL